MFEGDSALNAEIWLISDGSANANANNIAAKILEKFKIKVIKEIFLAFKNLSFHHCKIKAGLTQNKNVLGNDTWHL